MLFKILCACPRLRADCGGVAWVLASFETYALIGSARFMVPPAAAIFVDVSYQRDLSGLSAVKAETTFPHSKASSH